MFKSFKKFFSKGYWRHDYFWKLSKIHQELTDKEFLKQFKPILKSFYSRKLYLYQCAITVAKLYNKCKILEVASGCNVFPSIMNCFGYQAVGLEPKSSIAARYCRIEKLPIITPKKWGSHWTDEHFDVVVLICYYISPTDPVYGKEAVESLWQGVFKQLKQGAELVVFDKRYIEPLRQKIENLSLPIECKINKFAIFFERGEESPFRRKAF